MKKMGSLFQKVKGIFVTSEEYYDDEYYEDEDGYETYDGEYEDEKEPSIRIVQKTVTEEDEESVRVEKPSRNDSRHEDFTPYSFDDMASVVDCLKSGKAVILYLHGLETPFCQRVLDFSAGAAYSMDCICDMPTNDVCILIPRGMDRSMLAD